MGPDNWLPGWDPAYQQTPPSHSTNETFVGFGPNGKYEIGQTPYFFYIQGAANSPMRKNNTAYNTHDMIMTPDTPSGLIFTNIVPGTTAASQPAGYATATDTGIPLRSPSMGTVINDGTAGFQAVRSNPYFPITRLSSPDSRAHAGLPALVGYVGYGDDSARFPLPAACGSRSAGNVAVP